MSTALDTYLRDEGIKDADFAPLIERDRSMVSKLRNGRVQPTIELADRIEKATGGRVPIQSWLRTSSEQQAAA